MINYFFSSFLLNPISFNTLNNENEYFVNVKWNINVQPETHLLYYYETMYFG